MRLRFYLDRRLEQPHIHLHDVTEAEVEEVLACPDEDRPGSGGARVALGRTGAGHYLRVIYVRDAGADSAFVITAYTLCGRALTAYKRRRARKPRRT
jgi:hypothetical protein